MFDDVAQFSTFGNFPYGVALGDVIGPDGIPDGFPDLAVVNSGVDYTQGHFTLVERATIDIFRNKGGVAHAWQGFELAQTLDFGPVDPADLPNTPHFAEIRFAHIFSAETLDLVVTASYALPGPETASGWGVYVFVNDGDGNFSTANFAYLFTEHPVRGLAVGDLNFDGVADIAAAVDNYYAGYQPLNACLDQFYVFYNTATGFDSYTVSIPSHLPPADCEQPFTPTLDVAIGHFNRSGVSSTLADSFTANGDDDTVWRCGNFGMFNITPIVETRPVSCPSGSWQFWNVAAAKLTLGNLMDDAVGRDPCSINVFHFARNGTMTHNCSGSDVYGLGYCTGLVPIVARIKDVAVGNFNGGVKPDVVTTVDNRVAILLGNGSGGFQYSSGDAAYHPSVALAEQSVFPIQVATGDIDLNGFDDIVTGNNDNDTVSVLISLLGVIPPSP